MPKLEAYGAELEGNNHGFSNSAFFLFLPFQFGRYFFNNVSPLRTPEQLTKRTGGLLLSPVPMKSSARQPERSLKCKKLSKVKFLRVVNFLLAPQRGLSVRPAPGRSWMMSAALHNLQALLRATTCAAWEPSATGTRGCWQLS